MRFLISYFYQLRFFKEYIVPFSTAKWDPRWFHEKNGEAYFDNNGVINGLRLNILNPNNTDCKGPSNCNFKPEECPFMNAYKEQLKDTDFTIVKSYCESVAMDIQKKRGFTHEPIIVLLVYEIPGNPCSERIALKEWFLEHGYALEEFEKGKEL